MNIFNRKYGGHTERHCVQAIWNHDLEPLYRQGCPDQFPSLPPENPAKVIPALSHLRKENPGLGPQKLLRTHAAENRERTRIKDPPRHSGTPVQSLVESPELPQQSCERNSLQAAQHAQVSPVLYRPAQRPAALGRSRPRRCMLRFPPLLR